MDDDEDYQALFFTECRELLTDLAEHLDVLAAGEGDLETVNAAFRAVHSVKGGAAAFGFDTLISFAHVFETVMDQIRGDRLELTDDVSSVLLRAGDVMEVLVEQAQLGGGEPPAKLERVLADLEEIADIVPTEEGEDTSDLVEAQSDAVDVAEADLPDETVFQFLFAPGPDFIAAGHDPLRFFKSARNHGLTEILADPEVVTLDDVDPAVIPIRWTLTFETEETAEDLDEFFEFYRMVADITPIGDPVEDPVEEAVSDQSQASAPDFPEEAPQMPPPAVKPEPEKQEVVPERPAPVSESEKARAPEAQTPAKPTQQTKSLRVDLNRIDRLVNLVGEMLITQAGLAQRMTEETNAQGLEVDHSVESMSRQLRELQESVMAIRAQPVKSVFSRMPRVVRDLADKLNKKARLELTGEQTEVDTTVIEELSEPLTHMLRNSMDHGIEDPETRTELGKDPVGLIRLSAEHKGERVIIVVQDDGRGIDRDRVLAKAIERDLVSPDDVLNPEEIDQLIFHPGFSTASEVSSVSGRGVGMDVVKKKIQSLGGRCVLVNNPGKGSRFTITLPLTLAVMDGMTVTSGGQQFILPLSSVVEAVRVGSCKIRQLPDDSSVMERRGDYLRLLSLRKMLDMPKSQSDQDMAIILDTETDGHVALQVDDLIGQRQVVLKSLEANFKKVAGVSGATILGDGHVALILDVPGLIELLDGTQPAAEMIH